MASWEDGVKHVLYLALERLQEEGRCLFGAGFEDPLSLFSNSKRVREEGAGGTTTAQLLPAHTETGRASGLRACRCHQRQPQVLSGNRQRPPSQIRQGWAPFTSEPYGCTDVLRFRCGGKKREKRDKRKKNYNCQG